jgi:hypothetical protein
MMAFSLIFDLLFNSLHEFSTPYRGPIPLRSDRFISVIVDKGETLINCLAYIDLNPFRAGIVSKTYKRFKHHFNTKHEKKPKPVKGLSGVYSLKRLSEVI